MLMLFAFVAIVVLFSQVANLRSRLKRAEDTLQEAAKRIGALQRLTGLLPPKAGEFPENQIWPARRASTASSPPDYTPPEPATPEPQPASSLPMAADIPEPEVISQEVRYEEVIPATRLDPVP